MKTFLLIHGSMLGGWCWSKVSLLLRSHGHAVFTPTLTGMGERVHLQRPEIDHHTYVEDILNVIKYESLEKITLVGHSYSGLVATCTANAVPEKISRLVFLDAVVVDNHKSYFDVKSAAIREKEMKGAIHGLQMPPESPKVLSYLGVHDHQLQTYIHEKLTPMPLAAKQSIVTFDAQRLKKIPTNYIHCTAAETGDYMEPSIRRAKERGWPAIEIAASHMPMITDPELVASTLMSL